MTPVTRTPPAGITPCRSRLTSPRHGADTGGCDMFGRACLRGRWSALGAAVAVTLGFGGLLTASAAGSTGASSFVPITPCRLLDTRAGDAVGPRSEPLHVGDTYTA